MYITEYLSFCNLPVQCMYFPLYFWVWYTIKTPDSVCLYNSWQYPVLYLLLCVCYFVFQSCIMYTSLRFCYSVHKALDIFVEVFVQTSKNICIHIFEPLLFGLFGSVKKWINISVSLFFLIRLCTIILNLAYIAMETDLTT